MKGNSWTHLVCPPAGSCCRRTILDQCLYIGIVSPYRGGLLTSSIFLQNVGLGAAWTTGEYNEMRGRDTAGDRHTWVRPWHWHWSSSSAVPSCSSCAAFSPLVPAAPSAWPGVLTPEKTHRNLLLHLDCLRRARTTLLRHCGLLLCRATRTARRLGLCRRVFWSTFTLQSATLDGIWG